MTSTVYRAVLIASLEAVLLLGQSLVQAQGTSTPLVQEGFEDASVASRGWYDSTGVPLSLTEKYAGTRWLECHFTIGATGYAGGQIGRHLFPVTDSVYLSYHIKHSAS